MMMKKIIGLTLAAVLTFSLAACGGKDFAGNYEYNLEDHVKLGEYKGLEYQDSTVDVTEQEVQGEIDNRLAAAKGTEGFSTELKEEAVAEGDVLSIDFLGKVDGVAFEGGEGEDYSLTIGSGQFIPGFEEGLIGWKVGDKKDLNVTFPADYGSPELAGKEAVFTVTINSGTRPVMPEYGLDFVTATSEFKSLEEYEAAVKEELLQKKTDEALALKQNTLWNQVMENAEILGYPEGEVDARKQENIEYYTNYATQYNMDLNSFVTAYFGMDEAAFADYLDMYAQTIVEQEMVMYAIAKAEGISLSDKEYKDLLVLTLKEQGFSGEDAFESQSGMSFEEYAGKENLQKTFLLEKVINFIVENAAEKA